MGVPLAFAQYGIQAAYVSFGAVAAKDDSGKSAAIRRVKTSVFFRIGFTIE
jgi:hypothetical protein